MLAATLQVAGHVERSSAAWRLILAKLCGKLTAFHYALRLDASP